jgi:hypothetical protein
VYSVVGIVRLQLMAYVFLFPKLSTVYFYICIFRRLLLLLLLLLLLMLLSSSLNLFVTFSALQFGPLCAQATLRPAHLFSPVRN